jgi:uncharacterized repeat protein (TIGR01451 family)
MPAAENQMTSLAEPVRRCAFRASFFWLILSLLAPDLAHASLTVSPLTWNIIGLDSNAPAAGAKDFPVGARICSDVATTNVTANFVFDSANPNIDLRPGSLSTLHFAAIAAGACADAYFEVEVNQVAAAYGTTRRFHIAASDGTGTYSTPTPREFYVEHLISQSRNSTINFKYGTSPSNLVPVAAGGALDLVVGNTYTIELDGGTATQGYEQFEGFINFSNAVFQILAVTTTYSADSSPFVPNPNNALYADACLWESDPNSPNYRSCVGGAGKAGGSSIVTTYTIKIIGGGGSSQTLNTLMLDFSGSSFHYNGDYSVSARFANIIDPATANIAKSFSPNPVPVNGVSALTITLANPNAGALSGYNFVDTLPAGMTIASPSSASTAGCGTPTLAANAGADTISFSGGSVAGNGRCIIKVNVTTSATGSFVNTTGHLFIDALDTGHDATATLTVNNGPPPGTGICGLALATWRFPTGFNINSPAATSSTVAVSAAAGAGTVPVSETTITADGTAAWGSNGSITTGTTLNTANNEYFEFGLDTTGLISVSLAFRAQFRSANGPKGVAVFQGTSNSRPETGTSLLNNSTALTTQSTPVAFNVSATAGLNGAGTTYFRVYFFNSGNTNPGADPVVDDVVFTGCATGTPATISKIFAPNPLAVNGVSTLTFALNNPNSTALTGAAFTDALPGGTQVAASPAAATTCGGSWAPTAGATSLTFSGGTIPANGSCSVSVNVTATTAGPHGNVSGFLSTNETGTNTENVASDTLTALAPPQIAKNFSPSPILAGGISRVTFTIGNPNPNDTISGVAFSDTLPTAPGAMVVALTPNASTTGCGAPTFAPVPGTASIALTNGMIGPGGTCSVHVDVTAPAVGTYNNVSGPVSFSINGQTVNGNTANASLGVTPPQPAIGLLKQVGESAAGPWLGYTAVALPGNVYYRFTIENDGDVPLSPVTLGDPQVDTSSCTLPASLPVAVAANNNHIFTCVVGPFAAVAGSNPNTATAQGTGGGIVSATDSATYASATMSLVKSVTEASFTAPGDTLHYTYFITNTGAATLDGPIIVNDDKATVTCLPLSTTGDGDDFFDPGEQLTCSATYVVTAGDVSAASVINTAQATNGTIDSNTDSFTVPLSSSADVSITKTLLTAPPFTAGQPVTFTLVVANAGPSTATSVQVTDSPTNLVVTNVSGAGCAALPCTIGSLAVGASATITVTAVISAPGTFDNSATASAAQPDPDPTNNTDDTGNGGGTIAPADVSISKTLVTGGPYLVGQLLTYTLVVANAGPSTATNVQVTDTPVNLTITNVSGGGCTVLPCTIASLAAGANVTITVAAVINAAGAFDNIATVTANEFDPNPANNTDSDGNGGTASAVADVSINKTLVTAAPYTVGQTLVWTLIVANAGPSTATNVQVTDTPTNVTITSVSGGGCNALPCTIASLAPGASVTITTMATIDAAGAFDNAAAVTAAEFDPNLTNNADNSGNGGTAGAPQLTVAKTASPMPFTVGVTASYVVTVTNTGNAATTANIIVTDTLPGGITLTSASGANWACTSTTNLSCTFSGTLAPGANAVLTLNVDVAASAANGNNTATASGGGDATCPGTARCSGTVPVDVTVPRLATSKTGTLDNNVVAPANESNPGDTIAYTITVANSGTGLATGVTVADPLLPTLDCTIGGSAVSLPTSLAAGASLVCTGNYTLTASDISHGSVANTATASAGNVCNPTTAGSTCGAGTSTPLALQPVLATTKSGVLDNTIVPPNDQSNAGDQIHYTITVANSGNGPALGVNLSDAKLPALNCATGGSPTTLPTTIAAGATLTCSGTYTLTAGDVSTGSVTNAVTVSGSNVCPPGTGCTGTEITPLGQAPVLAVTKSATPTPFVVGQAASYAITVANNGTAATTAPITVTDALPGGITLATAAGTNWNCIGTSNLSCTFNGTLAAGATTMLTLHVTVTASATSGDNSAIASGGGDSTCPAAQRCTGNVPVPVTVPELTVGKTATPNPFVVGQPASYAVTVTNSGSAPTNGNITVSDTLPNGITLKSASGSNWTCTGSSTLSCTFTGTLAVSASTTLTLDVNVGAAATSGTNTATASGGGDPTCPAATHCSDTVTVGAGGPQLSVTKTASPLTFIVGQPASYSITVRNSGSASTHGAIQITDTLPAGITLQTYAGANWTCSGTTSLSCSFGGTLAPAASTSLTLNVVVGNSATTGNNTAIGSGGGDAGCPAAANCNGSIPVEVKPANRKATPTPVDARWMLVLLGVLLVLAAAGRRRV